MKRLSLTLGLVALAAVLAACSGASAAPAAPTAPAAPASVDPNAPTVPVITARDIAFVETEVTVDADKAFELILDNQEGAPHNIKLSDAAGTNVFTGEIVSNTKVTYQVPALAAGAYTYICELHPNMKGTLVAK
jgi:plastocyanin